MADISLVYNALKAKILENRSDLDIVPGSVISDVFLLPTATEITKLRTIASFIAGLQSFSSMISLLSNVSFLADVAEAFVVATDDVTVLISGAIDKLAANFNKTRKVATAATGTVSYYRPDPVPAADLGKTVAVGTEVRTNSGVTYSVTQEIPYSAFYYDATYGVYMLDVPVECQSAGTVGNVPTDSITVLGSAVDGFGSVTNKVPFTNAVDNENDVSFANRMMLEISGNNLGTVNGIKSLLLNNIINVSDARVVTGGDPFMTRDEGWGGAVDVYILEKNPTAYTWTFDYNGEDYTYIKGTRPVITGSSITASEGTAVLFKDTTSDYAGSVRSLDRVAWTVKPTGPYPKSITLSYFYDKNVTDSQDLFDQDDYNTGADLLIKQATEVPIDITFDLVVLTGYAKSTVSQNISNLLTTNISALKLGENLEQSDVIAWIASIDGVARIVLPLTKFNRSTESGTVDVIKADANEYLRLNKLLIN